MRYESVASYTFESQLNSRPTQITLAGRIDGPQSVNSRSASIKGSESLTRFEAKDSDPLMQIRLIWRARTFDGPLDSPGCRRTSLLPPEIAMNTSRSSRTARFEPSGIGGHAVRLHGRLSSQIVTGAVKKYG